MVLAAGAGRRLQPLTDDLPKTLLPVDGERTILDIALANLKAAGLDDVVVVTGFAAHAIDARKDELERSHGVNLELVFNEKAEEWNNAYSLWVARESLRAGAILVNGDTVHPASVEETVLAARGPAIVLAAEAAEPLGDALEATWKRDPGLYYEDGYQEFADRGGRIGIAPIGSVEWVEVDDHADLAR